MEQLQFHVAGLDLAHELVDQDGLGAELVAAVDQGDLAADVGQVQRFFDGGVAAAHHDHVLVAVEKAVAGGAAGHAAAHEGLFRGQAQVFGRCAGGDDEGVAGVDLARVAGQREGALGQINLGDVVEQHFGVEAFGVLLETLHQVGALDAIRVGGPVIDVRGGHQLAALGQAGHQDGAEVGACRIDGRRVTGGAGTEYQNFSVRRRGHGRVSLG
ncbi:hypothetical protein D3C72_1312050 [compost metagenome]